MLLNFCQFQENRKAMHSLWEEILASGVCITLHNGLVDLAFIHEHFYAELPVDPDVFTANLADWFPAFNAECSVFDSKYVAEYGEHFSTSFLEYLFRKCQRLNWTQRETGMVYIDIRFPPVEGRLPIISEAVEHISCRISERFRNRLPYNTTAKEVCETFRVRFVGTFVRANTQLLFVTVFLFSNSASASETGSVANPTRWTTSWTSRSRAQPRSASDSAVATMTSGEVTASLQRRPMVPRRTVPRRPHPHQTATLRMTPTERRLRVLHHRVRRGRARKYTRRHPTACGETAPMLPPRH